MPTLKVTASRRVTLSKDILNHLGAAVGGRLMVVKLPNGRIRLGAEGSKGEISEAFGMLARPGGPRLTIEEINEAAADAWAGKR
jgi:hypothetical protein